MLPSIQGSLLQPMDIYQVIAEPHLVLELLPTHQMSTGVFIQRSEMLFNVSSQLVTSFPILHTPGRLSGLVAQAKRAIAWPDERMAICDDFTQSGRNICQMYITMVLPLIEGIKLKTLVAEFQFAFLATEGIAKLLSLAILDMITPPRLLNAITRWYRTAI